MSTTQCSRLFRIAVWPTKKKCIKCQKSVDSPTNSYVTYTNMCQVPLQPVYVWCVCPKPSPTIYLYSYYDSDWILIEMFRVQFWLQIMQTNGERQNVHWRKMVWKIENGEGIRMYLLLQLSPSLGIVHMPTNFTPLHTNRTSSHDIYTEHS